MNIFRSVRTAAEAIERAPIGIAGWCATLGAIIAIRNVLETFSSNVPVASPVQFFVFYPLAYVAPLLALTLVLALFSGERADRVAKLMLLAWVLTLLPPLIDAVFGRTGGEQIGYLGVSARDFSSGVEPRFLPLLLQFVNPGVELHGTTSGIRIETALACLLGGLYVLVKGRGWLRALLCTASILPVSVFFFTLPIRFHPLMQLFAGKIELSELLENPGRLASVSPDAAATLMIVSYLVPLALTLLVIFLLAAGSSSLRHASGRLISLPAVVAGMSGFIGGLVGMIASPAPPEDASPAEWIAVVSAGLSCLLIASAFPRRPSSGRGKPDPHQEGNSVPLVMAGFGAGLAAALGPVPFVLAVAVLAAASIETLPPWRPGRWPVVGEAAAGATAVLAGMTGCALYFGSEVAVMMPPAFVLAILAAAVLLRVATRRGHGSLTGLRAVAAALVPLSFPFLLGRLSLAVPMILVGAASGVIVFLGTARLPRLIVVSVPAVGLLAGALFAIGSDETIAAFRDAAVRSPWLHLRRGHNAVLAGDTGSAREAYLTSLEKDERFVPALMNLGALALRQRTPDLAVSYYGRALKEDPGSSRAAYHLGVAQLLGGSAAEAYDRFEEAVRMDPNYCDALLGRAEGAEELQSLDIAVLASAWREYLDRCAHRPEQGESVARARARLLQLKER